MNIEENNISSVARQFGLNQLKPKQIEVISAFVGGRDVHFCFPLTGRGKSIIYAALPFVLIVLKVILLYDYIACIL